MWDINIYMKMLTLLWYQFDATKWVIIFKLLCKFIILNHYLIILSLIWIILNSIKILHSIISIGSARSGRNYWSCSEGVGDWLPTWSRCVLFGLYLLYLLCLLCMRTQVVVGYVTLNYYRSMDGIYLSCQIPFQTVHAG